MGKVKELFYITEFHQYCVKQNLQLSFENYVILFESLYFSEGERDKIMERRFKKIQFKDRKGNVWTVSMDLRPAVPEKTKHIEIKERLLSDGSVFSCRDK